MDEQTTNWIENLKKGDKVYCVSEQYGNTDYFKIGFLKTINKETVTIVDEAGGSCGCYYKKTGGQRSDNGVWSSRHTYILNPAEESVKQKLINYTIRKQFANVFAKVLKLTSDGIKVERKQELIPIMEAFLAEFEKSKEIKP